MDAKLENNGENVEVREKCNQAAQSSAVAQSLASMTIHLYTYLYQNGERNMEEREKCNKENMSESELTNTVTAY